MIPPPIRHSEPVDITPQATRTEIVRRVQAVADVVRSQDSRAATRHPNDVVARLRRATAAPRKGPAPP